MRLKYKIIKTDTPTMHSQWQINQEAGIDSPDEGYAINDIYWYVERPTFPVVVARRIVNDGIESDEFRAS